MIERRWVFDTNVLISRLLNPRGAPARAVDRGLVTGVVLLSDATFDELTEVLMRRKFDPYLTADERQRALGAVAAVGRRVAIVRRVAACRDPRDDKFLEVAVNGRANALVSGDADLLALHPYLEVPILSPEAFLASVPGSAHAAAPGSPNP
jgi:putative PIN family toxin of toxin-antitoxin system